MVGALSLEGVSNSIVNTGEIVGDDELQSVAAPVPVAGTSTSRPP